MTNLRDDELDPALSVNSKFASRQAWVLCWLMFASTVLNYMDRQAVSVVGEHIIGEFHLRFEQFGWVIAAFQLTYAFFQVPAGYLSDRLPVRWTYAGAVLWWSLAAVAVAFSPVFSVLLIFRATLGIGESFNWPCALKVTGQVLPPEDRGLGNGIFNSGAAVGAVLTPLILTPLTLMLGWRWSFALIGLCGFVWVFVWILKTRQLSETLSTPARTDRQQSSIETLGLFGGLPLVVMLLGVAGYSRWGLTSLWWAIAGTMLGWLILARLLPLSFLSRNTFTAGLGRIVRLSRFWVMCLVSISINICWHFLVNWLPTYLKTDRGLTFVAGSLLSALPFLAADVGNLGGGALARQLSRRGRSVVGGRMVVLAGCVVLISLGAFVGSIQSTFWTLVILALMALGTAAFMANYFAFCQEVSEQDTGLVVGVLGGLGNLFAAGFAPIVGRIKDETGGFGFVFLLVGFLPILGLAAITYGWREVLFAHVDRSDGV